MSQKLVVQKLRQRQLSWVGHAISSNSGPAKKFLFYEPETNLSITKHGRKTTSYLKYVSGLLFPVHVEVMKTEIESLASNRYF